MPEEKTSWQPTADEKVRFPSFPVFCNKSIFFSKNINFSSSPQQQVFVEDPDPSVNCKVVLFFVHLFVSACTEFIWHQQNDLLYNRGRPRDFCPWVVSKVVWLSTLLRFLKLDTLLQIGYIFRSFNSQKLESLAACADFARQSLNFLKITGTLKMNILFQNLQKPSLYFKNSCQKKNFKFKFKTKLL